MSLPNGNSYPASSVDLPRASQAARPLSAPDVTAATQAEPRRARAGRHARRAAALATTVVAVVLVARAVDGTVLAAAARRAAGSPASVVLATALYAGAFLLRAVAWRAVLPGLPLGHALAGLHVSLAANHLLPFRLGEPLRATTVARRTSLGLRATAASTVALRAVDVVALALVGVAAAPAVAGDLLGGAAWVLVGGGCVGVAAGGVWLVRTRAGRMPGGLLGAVGLVGAAAGAWVLEAAVVWQAASWAGVPLGYREAVAVTAVTIAAQLLAIAPGGLGTYEAAGTLALAAFGVDPARGVAIALAAHALKTAYALAAGAVSAAVPAPGLLGRWRLSRPAPRAGIGGPGGPVGGDGARGVAVPADRDAPAPVVLFLPAHDEAATVGDVVARVPRVVRGHPVLCVVVDDGSADATAAVAAAAGARLVRHGTNRGLGAAVRTGLAEAVRCGAVATAFCDADGEYAPEELERLVGPILDGAADYVVGSRFAGDVARMRPHRRLGNLVLTTALRVVARTPLTDGQSGYRALSARAAAAAEVVHDYNYAQVLTLDLLGKGFRYAEVPISYAFRRHGRSFVRLGRYLRRVVPAVHRELNGPPLPAATSS